CFALPSAATAWQTRDHCADGAGTGGRVAAVGMQTSRGRRWPLSDEAVTCPCHTSTSRRTGERRPSVADRHNQPTIHMLSASVRSLFSGSKGTGRRIAILSPVAATTKLKPQANDRQHGFRLRGNPIPFRFHHRYRDSSKSISCTSLRDVSSLISW